MTQNARVSTLAVMIVAVFSFAGCAKKTAQVTPPAPPPAAPTATLAANPDVIQQGQNTVLTWQTNNASEINIEGLGTVPASGTRTVTPSDSMTYTLTAKGPGGTQNASARVTVNAKVAQAMSPSPSDEDLFARNVRDVLFDYDKADIRQDQTPTAQTDAAFLLQHPSIKVVVEGHCDDRGSEEYNLALGTSRAESLKRDLLQQGVPADRVKTISYGKEKPFCTQDNDQCWQQNRVDHFSMGQ
ncbi:MAG TPA: OmpA family protein [Candidatus Sulfotelmatobacter sp.]|nr:OmpA family protein [Candidatus Sulfotelmatobacter sp.]